MRQKLEPCAVEGDGHQVLLIVVRSISINVIHPLISIQGTMRFLIVQSSLTNPFAALLFDVDVSSFVLNDRPRRVVADSSDHVLSPLFSFLGRNATDLYF